MLNIDCNSGCKGIDRKECLELSVKENLVAVITHLDFVLFLVIKALSCQNMLIKTFIAFRNTNMRLVVV